MKALGNIDETLKFVENLKSQWMATVDAIVDPLMIVDRNYRIQKANKALSKEVGKDVRELIGLVCHEVFIGSKTPCESCMLNKTWSTGKPLEFELENPKNNCFYEVTAQPWYSRSGVFDGVLHIYRDRTEARKLRASLLQSEKLASIGLLAGGVAHELNNPLGGILVFSQMLLREMDSKSPHYKDVKEIETATLRCKKIVEDLLDFAYAGRNNPKKSELRQVDMQSVVEGALKLVKIGKMPKNVDVVWEWPEEKIIIMANRNKMMQIFVNLITNSIQAMEKKGGMLTLRCNSFERNGRQMRSFEVEDTGVGIKKADLGRIFDPFYTTKEAGEGTGLGLSICIGIAKEYDGILEVESEEGEGSCFKLILPV
ncbi:MAG: PAS domain-containing protein [Oligoflexales bacterium]|nr:PAS domain-containing protein [Oligoflexales bacterium]